MAHVRTQRTDWSGPPVEYDCPYCGKRTTAKWAYTERETLNLVISKTNFWLVCSNCGNTALSKDSFETLSGLPIPLRRTRVVAYRSMAVRLLQILAFVFCLWPILGVLCTIPAFLVTLRRPGKLRLAMFVCLALSVISTTLIMLLIRKP